MSRNLYTLESSDPHARLVDRGEHSQADIAEISAIMTALGRLRDVEQQLSDASQRYMRLGRTDMRALHFLIVARNTGEVVTPGAISQHLGISSASTTKLLDRLEAGGHVTREPHPSDRRALAISITEETFEAANATVGRQQAKRFHAAARLTSEERAAVTRFLNDMADELTLAPGEWAE